MPFSSSETNRFLFIEPFGWSLYFIFERELKVNVSVSLRSRMDSVTRIGLQFSPHCVSLLLLCVYPYSQFVVVPFYTLYFEWTTALVQIKYSKLTNVNCIMSSIHFLLLRFSVLKSSISDCFAPWNVCFFASSVCFSCHFLHSRDFILSIFSL